MTPHQIGLEVGKILDITINITRKEGVLRLIRANISKNNPGKAKNLLVTPNPEQVMRAQTDQAYKNIINSAQIALPDGIGLAQAYTFQRKRMPNFLPARLVYALVYGLWVGAATIINRKAITQELKIIRGRDFFYDLMTIANKLSLRVYFLGSRRGVAQNAADNLAQNYKKVKIKASDAPELDENGKAVAGADLELEREIVAQINKFKPHFLILGISPPKQEKWVKRNWDDLSFNWACCFGATIDFVAGKLPLPPKWMANMGLEWIWRLITSHKTGKSPKRIFSAFPGLPWRVFVEKVKKRDTK